jgi:hypothetical protein
MKLSEQWLLEKEIEKILDMGTTEYPYEGTEIDKRGIKDAIVELIEKRESEQLYAIINNYVTKREGYLHIAYAGSEEFINTKMERLRDKAIRVLKRTDFDKEFEKVTIIIRRNQE